MRSVVNDICLLLHFILHLNRRSHIESATSDVIYISNASADDAPPLDSSQPHKNGEQIRGNSLGNEKAIHFDCAERIEGREDGERHKEVGLRGFRRGGRVDSIQFLSNCYQRKNVPFANVT